MIYDRRTVNRRGYKLGRGSHTSCSIQRRSAYGARYFTIRSLQLGIKRNQLVFGGKNYHGSDFQKTPLWPLATIRRDGKFRRTKVSSRWPLDFVLFVTRNNDLDKIRELK